MSEALYVVTDGDYSDYSIKGIYSTKERAEFAKDMFQADNKIEEWTLDRLPIHPKGRWPWMVRIKPDGTVLEHGREDIDWFSVSWEPYGDDESICVSTWARDAEHAVKIAGEKRRELIANNELTTDWQKWRDEKWRKEGKIK